MHARPLRQQQNAADDKHADDCGGDGTAQGHSTVADGLIKKIADSRAEWAR